MRKSLNLFSNIFKETSLAEQEPIKNLKIITVPVFANR